MSAITAPLRRTAVDHPSPRRRDTAAGEAQQRPRLRVVPRIRRRHGLAYLLLVCTILAGSVFGVVALNAVAAASAVEARDLQARVDAGERRYGKLVAEAAALEDPARIRELALEQGLVRASSTRYLHVERILASDRAITSGRPSAVSGVEEDGSDGVKSVLTMER